MAKSLVTGGCGFVGQTLIRALLDRGDDVVCLDHFFSHSPEIFKHTNVQLVKADIREREPVAGAMKGVDCVYHLAASVAPRSLAESRSINVEGTRNMAEVSADLPNPPVFVFISSLAAAGPNEEASVESGSCSPVSHYGRTKLEAEDVLRNMAARLPVTILRPPGVFGSGDRNLLSLYKTVRRGWNLVASLHARYSFLHVDDLITGLMAAAVVGARLAPGDDPERQGLYYLTDPVPVTFVELADMIADTMNCKVRHVRIPRPMLWTLGAFGESILRLTGRKTFMNLDKIREAIGGSWYCDGTRATHELDFAVASDLPTRLADTKAFYDEVGWL